MNISHQHLFEAIKQGKLDSVRRAARKAFNDKIGDNKDIRLWTLISPFIRGGQLLHVRIIVRVKKYANGMTYEHSAKGWAHASDYRGSLHETKLYEEFTLKSAYIPDGQPLWGAVPPVVELREITEFVVGMLSNDPITQLKHSARQFQSSKS